MPLRFYFFLFVFTTLFLFYPGHSRFFSLFAFHNDLFAREIIEEKPKIEPIPVIKNQSKPVISAQGAYIVDLKSFSPVFQKNEHTRLLPASTTKVITALVADDIYNYDEVVTVTQVRNEGQVMGLQRGEKITVEDLLYGALVHSGNDAAYALAYHYGYDEFIKLMNEKAAELGMRNSQFKNPAGLDAQGQYSTPYDLAIAGRALLANPRLSKMVSTKQITVSDVDFTIFHPLTNVNQLLGEIPGLGGLKTGYTEAAGQNLISFYKRNENERFLIVVQKSEDRFEDTRSIVNWINSSVDFVEVSL